MLDGDYKRECVARYREDSGQEMPSGLRRLLTYMAGVATIVIVAIGFLVAFVAGFRQPGNPNVGDVVVICGYAGWIPGLLISYTWRVLTTFNQMSLVTTLWRAAMCGLLYPVIVIATAVLMMGVVSVMESLFPVHGVFLPYMVGLLLCIFLSIPVAFIGVVEWSPKQPGRVNPDQSAPS